MSRRRPNITARLARAAATHPRRTMAGWLVAVVVSLAVVGTALSGVSSTPHAAGSPDSVRAAVLGRVGALGSPVSGRVPVVLAAVSILVGMGLVARLSLAFNRSGFSLSMPPCMRRALRLHYSQFLLSRAPEERRRGHGTR